MCRTHLVPTENYYKILQLKDNLKILENCPKAFLSYARQKILKMFQPKLKP